MIFEYPKKKYSKPQYPKPQIPELPFLMTPTPRIGRSRDWKSLGSDYFLCFVWEVTKK